MLELQEVLLVLFNSLQIGAVMLLWGAASLPVWPRRFMAIFFAISSFNLGVLWIADTPGGWINSGDVNYLNWLRANADAYSVWPLIALLISVIWPSRRGIIAAWSVLGLGTYYFLEVSAFDIPRALSEQYWATGFTPPFPFSMPYEIQAAAFYPVAALMVVVLGRRRDALAWLGLAMLPRTMFWLSNLVITLISDPMYSLANDPFGQGMVIAAPFAAAGIWFLVRRGFVPIGFIAAATLVGPLVYMAEFSDLGTALRRGIGGLNLLINLTTMALFRPLFAVHGIHPRAMAHLMYWGLAVTAATTAVAALLWTMMAVMAAKLLAIATGIFVLVVLESRYPLSMAPLAKTKLQPGDNVGPWRIESVLGIGRNEVYGGRKGRERVIIKLPTGPGVDFEGWRREMGKLVEIQHPNIVRVIGVEESRAGPCLVMARADGTTLSQRLKKGPLTDQEVVALGDGLLAGIGALHDVGIVHRDIKPSNILWSPTTVQIIDFDVARIPDADATIVGNLPIGTPAYMSPEQARGERADERSDYFAAAAVLHEARTGKRLIAGDRPGKNMYDAATLAGPPVTEAPWNGWFDRALHPDAKRRFGDLHAMKLAWNQTGQAI